MSKMWSEDGQGCRRTFQYALWGIKKPGKRKDKNYKKNNIKIRENRQFLIPQEFKDNITS